MPLTYGDLTRKEIDALVNSPHFPKFCERMARRMRRAVNACNRTLDAAIKADIEAMKERKSRCSTS